MGTRSVGEPGAASAEPSGARFDTNLVALGLFEPDLARRIAETPPRGDVEFVLTDDGLLSGSIVDDWGRRTQLASRRRPSDEADRLAGRVDLDNAAVVVVNGFAMGHHVRSILARARSTALVVVYEPDLGLMRAVLERQDHAAWLGDPLLRFITDAADSTALGRALEGSEGLVSLGLEILDHPPSERRLGDTPATLGAKLAEIVRSIRTNVVTTLAQADVTARNQLMNLDRYVACDGIADLRGCCAGRSGLVVSAGPSLARNLHVLEQPWVRERAVIVAVQTMLKPLLERGIRPHFVTALDYHEISRRFYEGLTAADVEGITLIAEAKANAAILDAWPGAMRCPSDPFLDRVLGRDPGERGTLKAGATVAHLAYYVARHLGCDPVILVGQDLGFTDGQYYGPNAAIHTVWGSELGEFCTLETLEWQRIKRMGGKLVTAADHLGRPMFTDDQMQTYRHQFERDFQADTARGLAVIDATEGGVAKAHTTTMMLAEALDAFRDGPAVEIPPASTVGRDDAVRDAVDVTRSVRGDVWKVADLSRRSKAIVEEMIEHAEDQPRVNRLIRDVYAHRDEVKSLDPAWELVHQINQRGTLQRARADREIHLADGSPLERQRAQMTRDAANLEGLAGAADELGSLMDRAIRAHEGRATKITREEPRERADATGKDPQRVWAAVTVDPQRSDLGIKRELGEPLFEGASALRLTLERLAAVKGIEGIVLATATPGEAAAAAGIDPSGGVIGGRPVRIIEVDAEPIADRRRAVRGARAFTPHQWRGGIAGWTYIDEITHPEALCDAAAAVDADALLVCGADWPLIDAEIGAAMIERFNENPSQHGLVFSQAAVGLSPAVLGVPLITSMRDKRAESGAFASIGAVLGYLPIQPANDPIAGTGCLLVDASVRDLGERVTADTPERRSLCRAMLAQGAASSALETAAAARSVPIERGSPEHLVLELVGADGSLLDADVAVAAIREAAGARPDLCVTLTAARSAFDAAEVLDHPSLARIAHGAAGAGALAVHVRTRASADTATTLGLLDLGLDAISIDLMADDRHTYELVAGHDGFDASRSGVQALIAGRQQRTTADGVPLPWLVARVTRRDAIYEQIDSMYDRWLLACGAAVIDPLPKAVPGERIAPLPVPASAADRLESRTMHVTTESASALGDGLLAAWRGGAGALRAARTEGTVASPVEVTLT
ncbi:MAG: 6-hydroxymethylpterin diphosphokinase MptE-like protein [Planctomycetota bacterium]